MRTPPDQLVDACQQHDEHADRQTVRRPQAEATPVGGVQRVQNAHAGKVRDTVPKGRIEVPVDEGQDDGIVVVVAVGRSVEQLAGEPQRPAAGGLAVEEDGNGAGGRHILCGDYGR